ncbi:long-chain acyl-CoA synthetase [Acinetobacter baylyi]|uniref:Long-chain acyl-CoA synthetase n=1 Tax=Acinetobacter baylyi TaxID=202950 RepID=A0ABU0USV7_ACIBI|nr:AMP-binding protein [Acinetobacter baylyi]MDQ1207388.1 long-chain acyl-CoA synthetase [Acinetobacter baylyi]MDR6105530.1 long-chain acyl-CoA synthetase [Acinetobacter baylyi]MDR6184259.1 long-chain acyl-CoA synthetase [Acinetobacter baylyi]
MSNKIIILGKTDYMSSIQIKHLSDALLYHARQHPSSIALRHKQFGLWKEWSWSELLQRTEEYLTALQQYQLQKEQTLLILSLPSIDVISLSLAIHALGGKVQLIENINEISEQDMIEILNQLKPSYVLVDEIEQIKNLKLLEKFPTFVFHSDSYFHSYSYSQKIISLDELRQDAATLSSSSLADIQLFENKIAFIVYQLDQKQIVQVSLDHVSLINEANHLIHHHQLNQNEQAFISRAFSSVGHIRYLWSTWLIAGFTLNIPENLETRDLDRKVIAPTLVLGTPQTYQRVEEIILNRLTPSLKKHILSLQGNDNVFINAYQKTVKFFLKHVVLEEIGFGRLKTALIVGEKLPKQTQAFYQYFGIELHHWESISECPVENVQTLEAGWSSTQLSSSALH